MTTRKKLIEVALPLEAINAASAREKSIRHGHPSTLHLWWARRPLAAARAVIFTSLVDDPDDPNAPPEFVAACRKLPAGANASVQDTPRQRLFDFIERLVQWESTTDEAVLNTARELIRLSTGGNPPPLLDPFAGGGSIPLEAQRLGLEAHASDLNPVAVMINKALIEIPPRFANLPPVNPRDRSGLFALTPGPSPSSGEGSLWKGAQGLAADVRYYGEWMRDRAWERIGHLYPKYYPSSPTLLPQGEKGEASSGGDDEKGPIVVDPALERQMAEVAKQFRKQPTASEDMLWQALRNRQLDGRKFRRQQPIGPFVVDFFCPAEKLVVEVDGPIHAEQRGVDAARQELIEAAGYRFVRVTVEQVESHLPDVLRTIRAAFLPSPEAGRGAGGEGETVIAWLWARTVKCPNPACGAMMPLVRSFDLSKKKGRQAWVEPIVEHPTPTPSPSSGEGLNGGAVLPSPRDEVAEGEGPGVRGPRIRFTVRTGTGMAREGTVNRRGATCIACGSPVPFEHIRAEGKAGRMGAQLMAIVTEGQSGRNYYAPTPEHERIAAQVPIPEDAPDTDLPEQALGFRVQLYGMTKHRDLFTPRQLVALTTFSDLVGEAREQVYADALAAGLPDDGVPLRDGGSGARAYAEAVSVYLAFGVNRLADRQSTICSWDVGYTKIRNTFARQAIPMTWDFAEGNPFSTSTGNFQDLLEWTCEVLEANPSLVQGSAIQADATQLSLEGPLSISTDPPYYDNIGYADLSDYFYSWLRKSLRDVYPEIFGTLLVPKEPELVATPYRFDGNSAAADRHFEDGLLKTFKNMRRAIQPEFPLTVYYAFKQSESDQDEDGENGHGISSTGWETMLESMIRAGLAVDGTWPMRTELSNRPIATGANALASSIVLVCRPRPDDAPVASRREFVSALRRELPPALRDMQSGSIAPVDLAQAAIGPGMAVYSRYRQVLEADGSPLTVRTALQLINQELDAFLAESEGDVDADTRFCIAWFEQFGFREGEFGVADVLARAKNTSVEGLVSAGVLVAGAGKVRLKSWDELEPGWTPQKDKRATVWEAVHHLIERLNTHGEQGAAALLAQMHSDLAAEAKNLAYRLYQICDRKGWAEHALEYNAVVLSWPGVQQQAGELKQNPPPEQLGLL